MFESGAIMSECRSIRERLKWLVGCIVETLRESLATIAFAALLFGFAQEPSVAPGSDAYRLAAVALDEASAESQSEPEFVPRNPRHWALAIHLSRRYGVAVDATEVWVSAAYAASEHIGIDPLLVLAVIAVESSFNPNAESRAGAQGLMQVVPRYHEDKLEEHGGRGAVFDPTINILVGTRILEQYIRHTGSLEAGLQRYNGTLSDASRRYAQKVLTERERLQLIVDRFERTLVVF
jgi:soluble lytic murein transglycosylase-like protein